MTIVEFVTALHASGIDLRLDGDTLKCSAPKGALTAEIAGEIKRRKPELMEFLNDALTAEGHGDLPIVPIDKKINQPLSVAQNSLWFVDRMMPGLLGYNLPSVFKLTGPLEVDVIERSLTEFIARHEILRATYSAENGEPVQNIAPAYAVKLEIVDMSDLSPISNETFFPLLQKETKTPFDLAKGPLFRIKFIRLGPEEHILFWMAHHMVWDGWSFDVMLEELTALYSAYSKGLASPLPPMTIQYGDFAAWQKEQLSGKLLHTQLEYWRGQLSGDLTPLRIPMDMPRPAIRSYRGDRVLLDIPKPLVGSLKTIGEHDGATLFMVLLAAYKVILYRYSGQEDISIGSPMWGRVRPETEKLIGFFTNTVVLRTNLEGRPSFREVVRRVKKVCLDAYSNQTIPFEHIVEQLPEASKTPLFQTLFTYQDARGRPLEMGVVKIKQLPAPQTDVSSFDLLLWFKETNTELLGRLDYNQDIFTRLSMVKFVQHIKGLLTIVVEKPDLPITELPILTEEERRQILVEWNSTEREYPVHSAVHELFERRVRSTPDKIAIRCQGAELSYAELDNRADSIAGALIKNGAAAGSNIGVCMTRCADLLAAILGVLKAACAYVPLDPDFPEKRLSLMISKARIPIILTDQGSRERLPPGDFRIISLSDGIDLAQGAFGKRRATDVVDSENAACIFFVSRPDFSPAPIAVPHRAVVNMVSDLCREPGLAPNDVVGALSPLSLGPALVELLAPLCAGAEIALIDRETSSDTELLMDAIEQNGVTFMMALPPTWRRLIEANWPGRPSLKALCHGEPLDSAVASGLLGKTKEVWNLYGLLETGVVSTRARVTDAKSPLVVGRPIANTKIYVLDDLMQPVAIGIYGRVCIGGAGLALPRAFEANEPDTGFIRDPFSTDPCALIFTTADQAKYLSDGSIEYCGRKDNQIKINGIRISPEEIETVLGIHGSVERSCVVKAELNPGDVRLVAYIVPRENQSVTPTDLRSHIRLILPNKMVPNHFEEIPSLPLTRQGIVDRKKLAESFVTAHFTQDQFEAPRSPSEEYIAGLWRELLGKKRVGVRDNFFEIGGYSLMSMIAVTRIEKETGVRLNPRVFLTDTLEQIASQCKPSETADSTDPASPAPPETHGPIPPQKPAKPSGGGLLEKIRERFLK